MSFLLFHSRKYLTTSILLIFAKGKKLAICPSKGGNFAKFGTECSTPGSGPTSGVSGKGVASWWPTKMLICFCFLQTAYIYMIWLHIHIFPSSWKQSRDLSVLPRSVRWPGTISIGLWALQNFNFQLYTLYWLGRQVSHYKRIVISK